MKHYFKRMIALADESIQKLLENREIYAAIMKGLRFIASLGGQQIK